jgi:hypothetical protein
MGCDGQNLQPDWQIRRAPDVATSAFIIQIDKQKRFEFEGQNFMKTLYEGGNNER